MAHPLLSNDLWETALSRLGGAASIEASARAYGAFQRPRAIKCATDLLRLVLAYCLGGMGLRLTSAWASSMALAELSNVALLGRLRNCDAWFEHLAGKALSAGVEAGGRRIRIADGTAVPKAGREAGKNNGLWRLHCVFDLPCERFSAFELTDEKGGERLDRADVVPGEIRIADRGFLHAGRLATVLAAGADVIVRAGWKAARWRDGKGKPLDLAALLGRSEAAGVLDCPVWIEHENKALLGLRLVAVRKPPLAAEQARLKARRAAKREGNAISGNTLAAAAWVILLTSLDTKAFPSEKIAELYRARWRIEMAFKRLKSLIGLSRPPGEDPRIAKTWILAHLLMILLIEPDVSAPETSPRMAA